MKQRNIFLIVCITVLFNFSYSQNPEKKKLGVIFNINGPYRITRQVMSNTVEISNVDKKDMFNGAYKFLETGKGNPIERIVNAYLKNLESLNVEIIQIKDTVSKANDPIFVWTKR